MIYIKSAFNQAKDIPNEALYWELCTQCGYMKVRSKILLNLKSPLDIVFMYIALAELDNQLKADMELINER